MIASPRSELRQEAGFTLVDTLMGLFVLTVALLAMGALLAASITMNTLARSGTNASMVAKNQMEGLRRQYVACMAAGGSNGCADADLTSGDHAGYTVDIPNPGNPASPINSFTVSWTIRVLDSNWQELGTGSRPDSTRTVELDVRVTPLNQRRTMNKMVIVHSTFAAPVGL